SRLWSLVSATPLASAASFIQLPRQLRQKPARFIRSMFCTSVRARRCSTSRRNTAASSSVWVLLSRAITGSSLMSHQDRRAARGQLVILQGQADVILRDGLAARARGEKIVELGQLNIALERILPGKTVQQRGHEPRIAHHLPNPAQARLRIAV